ncbi:MgtC/SapB family protein [Paenibacillus sp. LMG 31459]|uniref:MgtC/SapB family protein n=1 Tax=Paenibacillus phytohabitans TaxID=2654978 RepID=A0ABX1YMI9_9BACL|nr:MgtC/SapB family protein [Paenibacillus phytohabitans]NOU82243.1 MgtC/SapB family protein [Paenibacillus phytohabitans]
MEFELLGRVLLAGLCGIFIGFERKNRMKEAGVRTHFVVAVGAALMIIVSKYGFQDQIGWENLSVDPSRIAAGIVSGVGFLGAGMIFMQNNTVKGLTTAAGIWATAGIGMAVGAGMYLIGIGVALIIFVGQIILHGHISWLSSPQTERVTLVTDYYEQTMEQLLNLLRSHDISVLAFEAEREAELTTIVMTVKFQHKAHLETLLAVMNEESHIIRMQVE